MRSSKPWRWFLVVLAAVLLGGLVILVTSLSRPAAPARVVIAGEVLPLRLPDGFQAQVFAQGLNGPRFMTFDAGGVLYAADRGNNRIVALPDANGDGQADEVREFAGGLRQPHSVVYHEGAIYVGVPSGIIRLRDSDGDGAADEQTAIIDNYPTGGHSTRTVVFLPDGRMAVSIGSSCNVCAETDPRRATVLIYDGPEGGGERVFASGLRNAVGLAAHPVTGDIWATNNGRDGMGDDLPPESLTVLRDGANYGWPACHNGHIEDPQVGFEGACEGVPEPLVEIQAHSVPLGLAFYTGETFPAEYQDDLFIAYHGSWDRSVPTGYKVVRLPLEGQTPVGPLEDFAAGWLDEESGRFSGRPVGLAVGPDGALYVSDDDGGRIYRISYIGK